MCALLHIPPICNLNRHQLMHNCVHYSSLRYCAVTHTVPRETKDLCHMVRSLMVALLRHKPTCIAFGMPQHPEQHITICDAFLVCTRACNQCALHIHTPLTCHFSAPTVHTSAACIAGCMDWLGDVEIVYVYCIIAVNQCHADLVPFRS